MFQGEALKAKTDAKCRNNASVSNVPYVSDYSNIFSYIGMAWAWASDDSVEMNEEREKGVDRKSIVLDDVDVGIGDCPLAECS